MLRMFGAVLCPIIATELHNNLEPLMEPQSDSRVKTAVSSTIFVVRRAFGSMAAMTMLDLGFWSKNSSEKKVRAMSAILDKRNQLTMPRRCCT